MKEPLLVQLGERIRGARLARKWSQRELCETSGISHRFLIQLEKGVGNPSVLRLQEVAGALDISLVSLLAGLGPVRDDLDLIASAAGGLDPQARTRMVLDLESSRTRKVALLGLRGAGKTTLGRIAADRLGWPFVELDSRVRLQAGMSLADLFEYHGVERYRAMRLEVLEQVLAEEGAALIEAGGSIVLDENAYARLRASSTTIWLQASPEEHLERVRAQGDTRPMAGRADPLGELKGILRDRTPLYGLAHHALRTSDMGVDQAVSTLIQLIARPATGPS